MVGELLEEVDRSPRKVISVETMLVALAGVFAVAVEAEVFLLLPLNFPLVLLQRHSACHCLWLPEKKYELMKKQTNLFQGFPVKQLKECFKTKKH